VERVEERLQNLEYALMKKRKREAAPAEAEKHFQQAVYYRNLGKYRKAAKELEEAYALSEDFTAIYKRLYKLGR
jgi:tetratricopeptide (TPR) repeat protein